MELDLILGDLHDLVINAGMLIILFHLLSLMILILVLSLEMLCVVLMIKCFGFWIHLLLVSVSMLMLRRVEALLRPRLVELLAMDAIAEILLRVIFQFVTFVAENSVTTTRMHLVLTCLLNLLKLERLFRGGEHAIGEAGSPWWFSVLSLL